MDQFGVLVESIGFKAQGKSAPLADLKGKTKPSSINSSRSSYNSNSVESDLDGIFPSNNNGKPKNGGGRWDDYVDVFGGPVKASKPSGGTAGGDGGSMFDLDSIFKGSNNSSARSSHLYDDDIFGGMHGMKSSATVNYDDVFGSMASPPTQSDSMGDLLGNFDGLGLKSNGPRKKYGEVEKKAGESDDLIPGFGDSSPPKNGYVLLSKLITVFVWFYQLNADGLAEKFYLFAYEYRENLNLLDNIADSFLKFGKLAQHGFDLVKFGFLSSLKRF